MNPLEKVCAICGGVITLIDTDTMPRGVRQGIYYRDPETVWVPDAYTTARQGGAGIPWQFLHTRCYKAIQAKKKLTERKTP
jgi:hypothetical protein